MANARTITLANLLAEIRYHANVVGLGTTTAGRHSDQRLAAIINRSHQRLRLNASRLGVSFWDYVETGTLSTTEASDGPYSSISLADDATNYPAGIARVKSLSVQVQNTWVPLNRISIAEEFDFQNDQTLGNLGARTGVPRGYFVRSIGAESTTTVSAVTIGVFPVPSDTFTYALRVLPNWSDIAYTNTTYVFHGPPGFEEWLIWDGVIRVCARDNDVQQTYRIAVDERRIAWQEVLANATGYESGTLHRLDTRSRRRKLRNVL